MTKTRVVHAGSAEFRNDPTAVYIGRACRRAADPRCHVESPFHNPFVYSPRAGFRELLPDQAVTYLLGSQARGRDIYVKLWHRSDVLRAFALYAQDAWMGPVGGTYRTPLPARPRIGLALLDPLVLEGKTLGCWCKRRGDEPCHGDVLVRIIETLREVPV